MKDFLANPLFVYSAVSHDQCAIHFGTSPILAFHCASALADIESDANEYSPSYSGSMINEQKLTRVMKTVKIQFKCWCSTFREAASSESTKIVICHYTGESLQLCYALQRHINVSRTNRYEHTSAPWNPPIVFDKNAKLESYGVFDVIDATGLTDTTPIPIVLISTIPLLRISADATIFTSQFEHPNANPDPHSALKSQWFCDPVEIFTLFGLAPAEYITRVCHNASLLKFFSKFSEKCGEIQSLWRFSWKRFLFGDFFALEPSDIHNLFGRRFTCNYSAQNIQLYFISFLSEMKQSKLEPELEGQDGRVNSNMSNRGVQVLEMLPPHNYRAESHLVPQREVQRIYANLSLWRGPSVGGFSSN